LPIFKYDDIKINYIKKGEGSPLVLVQGFGGKLTVWDFQISFFKQKMMVIALDNRGVGKSSRPNYPYTMDMFVEDLKNLLKFLDVQDKIHLCGHSMGGMIAQHFVLKYPNMVKSLILSATSPMFYGSVLDAFIQDLENISLEKQFERGLIFTFSRYFRKKLKEDKRLYEFLKNENLTNPTRLQDMKNQSVAISKHNVINLLQNIIVPTLIMVGSQDIITPRKATQLLHEKIPNSTLEVLKGVGHQLIIESSEKVNNLMWNFIQQHLKEND
jgi:3-oxoadipate enol-lactonase